jgi:starvation-inducible DNA-binding protein
VSSSSSSSKGQQRQQAGIVESAAAPDLGIGDENRREVMKLLGTLLADEYVLYTKTRKYHWNVYGSDFKQLHELFEEQYEALDEIIDEVAERIATLGGKAAATLQEFQQTARLQEDPGEYPAPAQMVENLWHDHESTIKEIRTDADACEDDYNDTGTNDFLTGILQKHEKMAWMLRETANEQGVASAAAAGGGQAQRRQSATSGAGRRQHEAA